LEKVTERSMHEPIKFKFTVPQVKCRIESYKATLSKLTVLENMKFVLPNARCWLCVECGLATLHSHYASYKYKTAVLQVADAWITQSSKTNLILTMKRNTRNSNLDMPH